MIRPLLLRVVLPALLLAAAAWPARAQTPATLLDGARAQLEDVQPDTAAVLLVRVLDRRSGASPSEQLRGWTLLGIAELMRNREVVARQAFRRALERNAELRIDSLAYLQSDVRLVFASEKEAYRIENTDDAPLTMTLRAATDTTISPAMGRYAMEVRPRRRARIVATVTPAGADNATPLWTDTTTASPTGILTWDLTTGGAPIRPGRYTIRLVATDNSARTPATMSRTIVISRLAVDTIVAPQLPEDSLLPETRQARPASGLLAGVALGAGAVALTSFAGNRDLNGGAMRPESGRFLVAGAVSAAALIGFLTSKGQKPVPENITWNQDLRDRYERLQNEMATENRRRLAAAPLRIRMEAARMDGQR